MKADIEKAIQLIAKQINSDLKDMRSDDALRFTQAALNMTHVLAVLKNAGAA